MRDIEGACCAHAAPRSSCAPRATARACGELYGARCRAGGRRAQRRRPRRGPSRRPSNAPRAGARSASTSSFTRSSSAPGTSPNLVAVRDDPRRRRRRCRTCASWSSAAPARAFAASTVAGQHRPLRHRRRRVRAQRARRSPTSRSTRCAWARGPTSRCSSTRCAGVPLLSTAFGARGLGLEAGAHYGDDRARRRSAALRGVPPRTASSPPRRVRAAPRRHVVDRFAWDAIAAAGSRTPRCASLLDGAVGGADDPRRPSSRAATRSPGARMLARDAGRAPPGLAADRARAARRAPPRRGEHEPFAAVSPADLATRGEALLRRRRPPRCARRCRARCSCARLLDDGAERVLVLPPDAEVLGPLDALDGPLAEHAASSSRGCSARCRPTASAPTRRDLLDAGEIDDEVVAVRADARPAARSWTGGRSASREAAADAALLGGLAARRRRARGSLAERRSGVRAATRSPACAGSRTPAIGVSTGTCTSAARAPRGCSAGRASAPTGRGGCPSTRRRSCVLDDPLLDRALPARAPRAARGRLDSREAEGADARRELPNGLVGTTRLRRLHAQALDAGEDFGDLDIAGRRAGLPRLADRAGGGGWRGGDQPLRLRRLARAAATCATRTATSTAPTASGFVGLAVAARARRARAGGGAASAAAGRGAGAAPRPSRRCWSPATCAATSASAQAARGYAAALQAAGVPGRDATIAADARRGASARGAAASERAFEDLELPEGVEPDVNLLVRQRRPAPRVRRAMARGGCGCALHDRRSGRGRPTSSRSAGTARSPLVDEIWVYSRYVAENLARARAGPGGRRAAAGRGAGPAGRDGAVRAARTGSSSCSRSTSSRRSSARTRSA